MRTYDTVFNLYHWSMNYECAKGPFSTFLDIIGWSEEALGENIQPKLDSSLLGWKELDLLADALKDYASEPGDVMDYVQFLMDCECEEIDVEDTSEEVTDLCRRALEKCYAL